MYRTRLPVAAKTAFANAGAIGGTPILSEASIYGRPSVNLLLVCGLFLSNAHGAVVNRHHAPPLA